MVILIDTNVILDYLQDKCAVMAKADYIVTRNVADYKYADTKLIIPSEFCKLVGK